MQQIHVMTMMRSGHNAIIGWLSEHYRAAGYTVAVVGPMSVAMYPRMQFEADVTFVLWPEHRPQQLPRDVRERSDLMTIVRDPYNLFASRMEFVKRIGGVPIPEGRLAELYDFEIDVWKTQQVWAVEHPQRTIVYNRWFKDTAYRRALIESRGLKFTDVGFGKVPANGGGSSFDGMAFDGRAGEMAVNERWWVYEHDPEWRRVLGQVELTDADRAAFGVDGAPELPRTESVVTIRHREAALAGFDPATERQGCCDPPMT